MQKKVSPFFSVIIPVFNNGAFLIETIESVISQTTDNWEAFIIDDGSTDNSLLIAKTFEERYNNIFVLKHPGGVNKGVSASRNLGISKARGEWIAFLDADDVWNNRKLEIQQNVIQDQNVQSLNFVYCTAEIIDEKGNIIVDKSDIKEYNYKYGIHGAGRPGLTLNAFNWVVDKGFEASTPSVVVKTDIIKELGGFEEQLTYSEDAIMWYRIIESSDIYFIDEPLLKIRVHGNSWNASVNRELKISRRFNAYEFLLNKVKDKNKSHIAFLLINKGFRIIVRNFIGYPAFNVGLIISSLKRIFNVKPLKVSLKIYSLLIIIEEVFLIPFRMFKRLFK